MRLTSFIAPFMAVGCVFSIAACSAEDPAKDSQAENAAVADASQFPVTIEHAFGETTIEQPPERVATVAWANHEVPLALGVVPVGMAGTDWGDDDDNGILPWVEDKLNELGADEPVLFDETDGMDYEAIADTNPDVILASYSGINQEEYDTLSKIAPVVAYPDVAWQTSMDEMIEMKSKALGFEEEGKKLSEDLDKKADEALEKFPDLKGKKPLFTSFGGASDPSKIGFYIPADYRMGFLVDHGFEKPQVVADNEDSDSFWVEISAEEAEKFDDVDFFLSYSNGEEADKKQLEDMQKDPLLSKIPAIKEGHVAFIDEGPLSASSNPSPLSIPWGVDRYFSVLNEAVQD